MVQNNSKVSETASRYLKEIHTEFELTKNQIQSINIDIIQQKTSIEQINSATVEIYNTAQDNAAISEKLNATLESVKENADKLDLLLKNFKGSH